MVAPTNLTENRLPKFTRETAVDHTDHASDSAADNTNTDLFLNRRTPLDDLKPTGFSGRTRSEDLQNLTTPLSLFNTTGLDFEPGFGSADVLKANAGTGSTQALGIGSRGEAVEQLQQDLANRGYSPGPADRIFGKQTLAALQAFQRDQEADLVDELNQIHPINERRIATQLAQLRTEIRDGVAGSETQKLLRSTPVTTPKTPEPTGPEATGLGVGSRGDAVEQLQLNLTELGYSPGRADRVFGNRTLAALQSFQQDQEADLVDQLKTARSSQERTIATQLAELRAELKSGVAGSQSLELIKQQLRSSTSGSDTSDDVLVPDLDSRSPTEQTTIKGHIDALRDGSFADQLSASISLTNLVDRGTLASIFRKLDIDDSALTRLATNTKAFDQAAILADGTSTGVDKLGAFVSLAGLLPSLSNRPVPDVFKKFLGVSKTTEKAINLYQEYQKDRFSLGTLKAGLELVSELRKLGKLTPFKDTLGGSGRLPRFIAAAVDLVDPSSSLLDRVGAFQNLRREFKGLTDSAVERIVKDIFPDLDVTKIAEGLTGADRLPRELAEAIDDEVLGKLTDKQIDDLAGIAEKSGDDGARILADLAGDTDADTLKKIITQSKGISNVEDLNRYLGLLNEIKPGELTKLTPDDLGSLKKLSATIGDLPRASSTADEVIKVIAGLDSHQIRGFSKVANSLSGKSLELFVKAIDNADPRALGLILDALSRVDPKFVELASDLIRFTTNALDRVGIEITAKVAGKVAKSLGKALPVVGAGFAFYDAFKQGQEVFNSDLPDELRFLNYIGVNINVLDGAYSILEPFIAAGTGGLGIAPDIALAGTTLAIDIIVSIEGEKAEAQGDSYNPPDWIEHANVAFALGTAPAAPWNIPAFFGIYGAQDGTQAIINSFKAGGQLAEDAGKAIFDAVNDGLPGAEDLAIALLLEAGGPAVHLINLLDGELSDQFKGVIDGLSGLGENGKKALEFLSGSGVDFARGVLGDLLSSIDPRNIDIDLPSINLNPGRILGG